VIAGTPQYMSPEQARGEPIDARSDLFSLGSLLYAMLAGRPPFRAETAFGVLRKISDAEPKPLAEVAAETPAWLSDVVGRLMEKRPSDRFGSAADVAELLGAWIAHLQQPGTVPAPSGGRRRHASRRKTPVVAAAGGGVCLLTLSAAWFAWSREGPESSDGAASPRAASERTAGVAPRAAATDASFPDADEVGGAWTAPRLTGRPDPWDQAADDVSRRLERLSVRLSSDLPPPVETTAGPPPDR
jgi:serine/threonine protein kinase